MGIVYIYIATTRELNVGLALAVGLSLLTFEYRPVKVAYYAFGINFSNLVPVMLDFMLLHC